MTTDTDTLNKPVGTAPALVNKEEDDQHGLLNPDVPVRRLTSRFGLLVNRASYADLLLLALAVLLLSSVYFWLVPDQLHSDPAEQGLGRAIYFSVVTFTSLGYGDLAPEGFGRIVAALVVAFGLVLTALVIGKVASERQANTLLLLHTSDTQRRIAEFGERLASLRDQISGDISGGQTAALFDKLGRQLRLTRGLANYLTFNAHHASVLEFGNFTALIGLYTEIKASFDLLATLVPRSVKLLPLSGDRQRALVLKRMLKSMAELQRVVERMKSLHQAPPPRGPLWRVLLKRFRPTSAPAITSAEQGAQLRLERISDLVVPQLAEARRWVATTYNPVQVERVYAEAPRGMTSTWSKGVHKTIAKKLGISNKTAQKCISELLETGRLPKPTKTPATKYRQPESDMPERCLTDATSRDDQ
ncbi:hypothetical protein GGQ97_001580 [Sphingomonas kaistensis]|uniref:Potassium channel domain-containing protein n=1 Tax=Sphingomonas kaistensis TaxID=298708 RepID=A0A7X5Y615_9SPHN|nr:potassium channel family protein [Sphingomonas kaistensis]NJC05787.1 hypothetical protein [Sphingomonas kaistensis]